METVAVLGMGLLGRGFAEGLRDRGAQVRVWNRTRSKAEAIAGDTVTVADTPAEAVRGADRVHLILSADEAVDAVILQLREGLRDGVPIIDHSTCLPARVAVRAEVLRSQGLRYLHAPVFMGPANAREATGLMQLSGPAADHTALRPALEAMTGTLLYQGEAPDQGAKLKLTGNGLMFLMLGAMGDLFQLGRGMGLAPEEVLALLEQFGPSPAHMARRALGATSHEPTFEMSMAHKDASLMLQAAGGRDRLRLLPVLTDAMAQAMASGRSDADFTSLAHPDHLD